MPPLGAMLRKDGHGALSYSPRTSNGKKITYIKKRTQTFPRKFATMHMTEQIGVFFLTNLTLWQN
jgi:hypothetical protein